MARKDLPPALVMGLSPTGLHVVRTLGEHGVYVAGVGQGMQAGRASRYMKTCIVEEDPQLRLEKVCTLFASRDTAEGRKPVLIPTSDQDVDFIIEHADRLAEHYSFQDSYKSGLATAIMSKDNFYELCQQHDVEYPPLIETSLDDLPGLADRLRFPVMVKPARIHDVKNEMQGKKGWTLKDEAALKDALQSIPKQVGILLAQEIVPGSESAITLYCAHFHRDGSVRQVFTARKLRQYPPGFGSASLVQSAEETDSAEIATRLLKALGFHGIAAAEFKRHPDTGRLMIIEINVRPSLWFSISEASSRPVVLSAYYELAGLDQTLPETAQEQGVRWSYGLKDAWSKVFYQRNKDFILPPPDIHATGAAKRTVGAVFKLADPLPAMAELANFGGKILSRIGQKFSR